MEFNQQQPLQNSVISYKDKTLQLLNQNLNIPCVISYNNVKQLDDNCLNQKLVQNIVQEHNINLLIIGTNEAVNIKMQVAIKTIINCEIMNIKSAIGSFNLLLSDERKVGLLLL